MWFEIISGMFLSMVHLHTIFVPRIVYLSLVQSSNQPWHPIGLSSMLQMSRHHCEELIHCLDDNCSKGNHIEFWSVKNRHFHLDSKLKFLTPRPPLSFGKQTLSYLSQLIFWFSDIPFHINVLWIPADVLITFLGALLLGVLLSFYLIWMFGSGSINLQCCILLSW